MLNRLSNGELTLAARRCCLNLLKSVASNVAHHSFVREDAPGYCIFQRIKEGYDAPVC